MSKFLRTHRVFAALLAAVLAAAAVWLACRWVGYDLQQRLGNEPEYEIINDEYSQIVDLPEDGGLIQEIPLQAGQAFYGVRLRFSTHDQLYKSGMVMVDVYNAQGEQLLQSAGNFLNIFNDTFTEFTTERPYMAAQDETLTVHLYNAVPWDGPLGLWASEGEVDGMALYNGADGAQALDATLAVQRVRDYSGSWPAELAAQLALPLAAAAFAAVFLAVLHAPLALLAAAAGLCLGLGFLRVTPALVAPDEYTHLAAAYELASVWGGQQPSQGGKLLVRSCDAPYFGTKTGEIGIFAYKAQAQARQSEPGGPDRLTEISGAEAGQGSGSYWAQAAGIRLARSQGKNFYTMLDWGRAANLLVYLALAAAAVALAPAALRGLFAAAALLPMPLQLAASLSPDAAVLGTVFLFTALCLSLRAQPGRRWQLALLVLLGAAVAPAKAIYLPVVLLCLAIPPEHLDPRRAPAQASVSLHGVSVRPGRLVLDVCGIKPAIMEAADCLPEGVDFIGCHPMAGKEVSGIDHAEATLFRNTHFIITPRADSTPEHLELLSRMAAHCQFRDVVSTTCARHDGLIAYTSQLMHVIALSVCDSEQLFTCMGFEGGSFRDCTRVAALDVPLWTQLFTLNAPALTRVVEELEGRLRAYRQAIAAGDREALAAMLEHAAGRKKQRNFEQARGDDVHVGF